MSVNILTEAARQMRARDETFTDAVADLLEEVAAWRDEGLGRVPNLNQTNWPDMWIGVTDATRAIARAYLGGAA